MERYSRILNKTAREIVLLKGRPCAWGKCTFCDYIEDNSRDKEEMISFYQEQLKSIEKELKVFIKANQQLSNKIKNIETIKGVGFITIVKVLAEVNGFLLFKNIRQFVSYAGLDVVEKESGNFKGKTRISKKGNARLRSVLYMPAMTAATHNNNIRTFYKRVNTDRKIKKHGIVAVMRKLLILIYTLWKKDEPYQIDYRMR